MTDSGGYVYELPSSINCSIWVDAEYLATDSGGYVYEPPSSINCSIWLDARSATEIKIKSVLSNPEDRILRYIRTYLFYLLLY